MYLVELCGIQLQQSFFVYYIDAFSSEIALYCDTGNTYLLPQLLFLIGYHCKDEVS